MDFSTLLYEVIDFRSFSNLWYWIVLAAVWSQASHYVLGVPWDMVMRAQRQGGEAAQDLHDMVRVLTNRMLYIARSAGVWMLGFVAFLHSVLLSLAIFYNVEWTQAVELIALPMTLVGVLSLNTAARIAAEPHDTERLVGRLRRHRMATQVIGMLSLLVTALYGIMKAAGLVYLG